MRRRSKRNAADRSPIIGITPDVERIPPGSPQDGGEQALFLFTRYSESIVEAGGIPLVLPPTASRAAIRKVLSRLDGLVISGGGFDIHPKRYGEKPIEGLGAIKGDRTDFELELIDQALERELPVLGVCGGAQAINVALGGTLYQDIPTQLPGALIHRQKSRGKPSGHWIKIHEGTQLRRIVRREKLKVNSTHHQAVKELGKDLIVNATSKDGLIEGIESPKHPFLIGVQWHPEALARKNAFQRKIFISLISICRERVE